MRGWSSAELTRVSREDLTERLSLAALASDIGFEAKKEWEFGPKRSQVKEGVGVGVEALKQERIVTIPRPSPRVWHVCITMVFIGRRG